MLCAGLKSATLEALRALAAAPDTQDSAAPTPMQRAIRAARINTSSEPLFAAAGQQIPARPEEQAFLRCISLSAVEPAEAIRALPSALQDDRATALVWALADLFEFLRSERAAQLGPRLPQPRTVTS